MECCIRSCNPHLLNSLKMNGLIDQDLINQKYRLGLKLLQLGNIVTSSLDILEAADETLNKLQEQFNETVHLSTLQGTDIIYLDKRTSTRPLQLYTAIGSRVPAHTTSTGKIMLAYLGEDYIRDNFPKSLKKITNRTITDINDLVEVSKKAKEVGYTTDIEENLEGLSCIGVPIFDYTNNVRYAISVAGPSSRIQNLLTEENINFIKQCGFEISACLGYAGAFRRN